MKQTRECPHILHNHRQWWPTEPPTNRSRGGSGTRLLIDARANRFFSYFTHLSYTGLVAYYFATGVQSLCYVRNRQKSYPLQRWPRPLQLLHLLLYSTISSYRELFADLATPTSTHLTAHANKLSW